MSSDYDVLIVGGGLVGASLACALAPCGLRIAVIEAVPYGAPAQPSYDDRTVALAYASKLIFEGIGIWSGLNLSDISPIAAIHISDRGRIGSSHLKARDAGTEALGYVVPARALGAALMQCLSRFSTVDLITPATLNELTVAADTAWATIEHNGTRRQLRAQLIVAADGARSRVRDLLHIEARTVDYEQNALVATVTTAQPHAQIAYERFTATGPLALLPLTDATHPTLPRRCALVWSLRPAQAQALLATDAQTFAARLGEAFGTRLGAFEHIGQRQSYPLHLTRARELTRARVAIIGNAAHTLHPVAGQGFNLGLRDVATLAELLCDARRAHTDLGAPALLTHYARWRRRDTGAVSAFTDGLNRIFTNDFAPVALARNLGLLAVDALPPLKRGLLKRTMGLAGRLPRLLRGLPL